MARRPALFSKVAKPVQSWWQRFAFSTLVLIGISMTVVDSVDIGGFSHFKSAAIDAAGPILSTAAQPLTTIRGGIEKLYNFTNFTSEIDRLKEENNKLKHWRNVASALVAENNLLRALNDVVHVPEIKSFSGRVIANSGGPFVKSILINVGSEKGAKIGQAVISGVGFVGSIVEVGNNFSRVLLVTDLNSQIPVVIQNTRDQGIMVGDNSRWPKLYFIPQDSQISVGDIVVTSGRGGVLPPDLPVGVISNINNTSINIEPFINWARLEYIRVLDYAFEGTIVTRKNNK